MKFKASLFALLVAAVFSFAQNTAIGTPSTQDSAAREDALQDILGQNYTPDGYISALDSATKDSLAKDSAQAESSSSGEGLVLYDGQSSSSSAVRHIGVDAPVYKYQVTVGLQSPSRGIFSLEYTPLQESSRQRPL
jgi:hypothetical protein